MIQLMLAALGEWPVHLSMSLLAVVQGVTEFLPVSSSGHLALGEMWLGIGEGSLVEEVALHVGTLVAVIFHYRNDLLELMRGALRGVGDARRYVALLVVGNVPAAIVGLGFKDTIEGLFGSVPAVLLAMAATAVLLASTRAARRGEGAIVWKIAILVGIAQAVAILPGASRSGWTIAVALWFGVRPVEAARFSFLLSIPAIAGATVLQATELGGNTIPWSALALGTVISAFTGMLCLRWLVALVRNMEIHKFAYYLGAVVVVGFTSLALLR